MKIINYVRNLSDEWYKWAYLTCALAYAILAVIFFHVYEGVSVWRAEQWWMLWAADSVLSLILVIPIYRHIAKENKEKKDILKMAISTPQGRKALAAAFVDAAEPREKEHLVEVK